MYIAEVIHKNQKITSIFTTKRRDAQNFAMDWSKNKTKYMGKEIPFGELNIHIYDLSNPCSHDHIDVPEVFY